MIAQDARDIPAFDSDCMAWGDVAVVQCTNESEEYYIRDCKGNYVEENDEGSEKIAMGDIEDEHAGKYYMHRGQMWRHFMGKINNDGILPEFAKSKGYYCKQNIAARCKHCGITAYGRSI